MLDACKDLQDFKEGEYVLSDIVGPADGFRIQLSFYPFESTAAYVKIFFAPGCEKGPWTAEQLAWEVLISDDAWERTTTNDHDNWVECPSGCFIKDEDTYDMAEGETEDSFGGVFTPPYIIDFENELLSSVHVRAKVRLPAPEEVAKTFLSSVDLTQQVTQVTFRLSTGPCLFLDKRVLMTRSEYFRKMLTEPRLKEGRTNEVDLSKDHTINCKAMTALLRFIMSDTFVHAEDLEDHEYYFDCRKLADRYQQKEPGLLFNEPRTAKYPRLRYLGFG